MCNHRVPIHTLARYKRRIQQGAVLLIAITFFAAVVMALSTYLHQGHTYQDSYYQDYGSHEHYYHDYDHGGYHSNFGYYDGPVSYLYHHGYYGCCPVSYLYHDNCTSYSDTDDAFIEIYILTNQTGRAFAYTNDLLHYAYGVNTSLSSWHYKTVPACIYAVYDISIARLAGYTLVYWLGANLDSYGTPDFNYPVIITNTHPDSDKSDYHTASVILSQTGGTRLYAVFAPDINAYDYNSAEYYEYNQYYEHHEYYQYEIAYRGAVPFGLAPPFWVTFDPNDGVLGEGQSPRITIINDLLATPPFGRIGVNFPTPPSRAGRQFAGWSQAPVGPGAAFTGSSNIYTDDYTVYARWGFEVTFDGNGVNLPAAQTSFIIPDRVTGLPPHSANTSYQFAWIYRSPGPGQPAVLVPPWPVNPVRTGWVFAGWYNVPTATGGDLFDANTPIDGVQHLFARWIPTHIYTITFVPNPPGFPGFLGGGATPTRQARYQWGLTASSQAPHNLNPGYLASPTQFVRTPPVMPPAGLNFVGWWTAPGGPGGTGQFAGWGRTTSGLAGGGVGPASAWPVGHTNPPMFTPVGVLGNVPITGNTNVYAYYVRRIRFNLNAPRPTFPSLYGFHWLHSGAANTNDGAVVDFPASSPVNTTVAANGRHMNVGATTYYAISEFQLPVPPPRPGYTFVGWFSTPAASGGTQFTRYTAINNFPWANSSQRQAYARWTANTTITLTFNANGGQWYPDQVAIGRASQFPASIQTRSRTQGATIGNPGAAMWSPPVPVSVPRRAGHVFLGWYEMIDGVPVRAAHQAPTDANRTFYAMWSDDVVFVTFWRDFPLNSVTYPMPRGTSWADRVDRARISPTSAQTQLNPLVHHNPHYLEFNSVDGRLSILAHQVSNPIWGITNASERSNPAHIPRPGSPPMSERTFFPLYSPIGGTLPNASRGGLWNTQRDADGRGTGVWWDQNMNIYEDMVFRDIWQTEITFDRNHNTFVPAAYSSINTRMTIQVPIGYSLGNRHTHPLFNYGGAGHVPGVNFPNPSGATAPYFTNRSDRIAWTGGPDASTWRPRNPVSVETIVENRRFQLPGHRFLGWNTNPNWQEGQPGEWFDVDRVLTINNGRTYYGIWAPAIIFEIGHAGPAGGVIAPEHRYRSIVFPGTWGIWEGPGQPYEIMPDPIWPGIAGDEPVFAGWNTNINGLGTTFDRYTTVPTATTLYAIWRTSVNFAINTLDPAAVGGGQVHNVIVGQPVRYVLESIPGVRPNWVFRHWNTAPNGSGATFYPFETAVMYATTVYGIWDGVVTFDPNGGGWASAGQHGWSLFHAIREGQTIATSRRAPTQTSPSVPWPTTGPQAWPGGMPENPARAGYSFQGWWFQDENDNWVQFTASTVMTMGNLTVQARWRGVHEFEFYKTDGEADNSTGWLDLPRLPGAQFFLDQWDTTLGEYVQVAGPFVSANITGRVTLVFPYPQWYQNNEFRVREIPPAGFATPANWRITLTLDPTPAGDVITINKEHHQPIIGDSQPMFERGYVYEFCTDLDDYEAIFAGWFLGNRAAVIPLMLHKAGPGLLSMSPQPTTLAQVEDILLTGAVFALYRYTGNGTPSAGLMPAAGWVRHGNTHTSTNNPLSPIIFGLNPLYTYWQLVEVVPPVGHMAPHGQWRVALTFDISDVHTGFVISIMGEASTPNFVPLTGEEGFVYVVGNRVDFELPLAGGRGARMYIFVGSFMTMLAFGLFVYTSIWKNKHKGFI